MVWGYFAASGPGRSFAVINGKMNYLGYQDILQICLVEVLAAKGGSSTCTVQL